jgi:hypothetical protein
MIVFVSITVVIVVLLVSIPISYFIPTSIDKTKIPIYRSTVLAATSDDDGNIYMVVEQKTHIAFGKKDAEYLIAQNKSYINYHDTLSLYLVKIDPRTGQKESNLIPNQTRWTQIVLRTYKNEVFLFYTYTESTHSIAINEPWNYYHIDYGVFISNLTFHYIGPVAKDTLSLEITSINFYPDPSRILVSSGYDLYMIKNQTGSFVIRTCAFSNVDADGFIYCRAGYINQPNLEYDFNVLGPNMHLISNGTLTMGWEPQFIIIDGKPFVLDHYYNRENKTTSFYLCPIEKGTTNISMNKIELLETFKEGEGPTGVPTAVSLMGDMLYTAFSHLDFYGLESGGSTTVKVYNISNDDPLINTKKYDWVSVNSVTIGKDVYLLGYKEQWTETANMTQIRYEAITE